MDIWSTIISAAAASIIPGYIAYTSYKAKRQEQKIKISKLENDEFTLLIDANKDLRQVRENDIKELKEENRLLRIDLQQEREDRIELQRVLSFNTAKITDLIEIEAACKSQLTEAMSKIDEFKNKLK